MTNNKGVVLVGIAVILIVLFFAAKIDEYLIGAIVFLCIVVVFSRIFKSTKSQK